MTNGSFHMEAGRSRCWILLTLLWWQLAATDHAALAATYYVDVDGVGGLSSDSNPGTMDRPFKTIERARDVIRATGADGVMVYLRGGVYRLSSPLTFDQRDSGVPGQPNVYRSYPGEQATVSSGMVLDAETYPWAVHAGGIYETNVGSLRFNSLFVDGQRAIRARIPNENPDPNLNYFHAGDTVTAPYAIGTATFTNGSAEVAGVGTDWTDRLEGCTISLAADGTGYTIAAVNSPTRITLASVYGGASGSGSYGIDQRKRSFYFRGTDISPNWTNLSDVEIVWLWMYLQPRQRIAFVDPGNKTVYTQYPLSGGNVYYQTNRYFVENVFEGLDAPGEWYLNETTGMLYYFPIDGKHPDTAEIVVPRLGRDLCRYFGQSLLEVSGAEHLAFEGLTFEHTDWDISETKGFTGFSNMLETHEGNPTYKGVGPGIIMHDVHHCTFRGNTLRHIGGNGLKMVGSSLTVSHNTITDIGGHGIYFGAQRGEDIDRYAVGYSAISDNTIHDIGTVFRWGKGIFVRRENHLTVAHNRVYDCAGMGIQVSSGLARIDLGDDVSNNRVEYNHISGVVNECDDGAALYTARLQPNLVFRYNLVHDMRCLKTDIWGTSENGGLAIYLDEGAEGCLVEKNWVYGVNRGVNYNLTNTGSGNIVRNNVFADIENYTFVRYGYNASPGERLEQNIFHNTRPLTGWPIHQSTGTINYNLYWNTDATYENAWDARMASRQAAGHDLDSIQADPLFVDVSRGNLRLRSESPAPRSKAEGGIEFVDFADEMAEVGPRARSLIIIASGGEGGTVSPSGETTVTEGGTQTFTFTPESGHSVADVLVDGVSIEPMSSYAFSNLTGDHSISVEFGAGVYALEVTATNGSVVKNPDKSGYAYNESVGLTATPEVGYTFTGWSGGLTGTANPATVVVDDDKSITADFAANTYTLDVAAAGGSVSRSPNKAGYTHGETVTLTAVADAGYSFSGWSGDASGASSPITITMEGDKSVTASFSANAYVLSIAASNGSVVRTPERSSYTYGETVSLQAVPSTGYTFTGWSGGISGSANPSPVVMNGPKSVTASFAARVYTLSVGAVNGTVAKNPNQATYTHGQTVALTAAADAGHSFSAWSGDASGSTAATTVTMDGNKSVTAGFTANAYALDVSATHGTVTKSPSQATYTHGQTVTLTAVADTGYSFSAWSGDASGTAASATITMDDDKSVTAGFTINTYTLTVAATDGAVTKSPSQATYTHGQTVTLTAVADTGYSFDAWSGDASGTVASTTITMDDDKSVTAGFTINTYTLTVAATDGAVTKSPSQATYTHGQTVALTAVADTGYSFSAWSGDASGTAASATITMDDDKSVTAGFAINTYALTVAAADGTVTKSPDKSSYAHGETVTLGATPDVGHNFVNWSGDLAGGSNPVTLVMDDDKSVTATFAVNTYTLETVTANGSVTRNPDQASYAHGETVTLTAVADTGYSFSAWSGDASGSAVSATLTMDGDKSVTAGFTIKTYTLATSASDGSITRTPDKSSYTHGETVTLQATPEVGRNFVSWSGDLMGGANPATLVMDNNRSVTAAFAVNTYTLETVGANGSVTRSPDRASYNYGETVTLTAVAATGYSFSGWSGDVSGTVASTTVTMDDNKTVTAGFTADSYVLTIEGANGSVLTVPTKGSYEHGETVSLDALPGVGYHFVGWSGDATGDTDPLSLVMDADKTVTAVFDIDTCVLDVTALNGVVTRSPDKAGYDYGETVSLQAAAVSRYEFTGWSGDLAGSSNPATVVMNGSKSVTANFALTSDDQDPPVLYGSSPASDAIQVPLNSLVMLRISDEGEGVDANAVSIAVNGETVYTGNAVSHSSASGVCRRVGTKASYTYAYQPTEDFDFDDTVAVTVNAVDLAGNVMSEQSYSFQTQMRAFGSNRCASWGPDGLDKAGPAAVCDAGGNIWAVWHAGAAGAREIYLARRIAGAEQFSDPVQITNHAADQCKPGIAVGTDGKLYVVWQDNRRGNWDVYVSTSVDGTTWSAAVQVTDSDNDEISPVIAVDGRSPNYAYVAWQDNRSGNQDIHVAGSSNGFASKTAVCVASNAQNQVDPAIAVDASNTVYLVWTDYRNGSADIYGAASNDGPWTNVAVATGPGNQSAPAITAEPTGSVLHFAWVSDVAGDDDICYGFSDGLPAGSLAAVDIIDDSSGADQQSPAIIVAEGPRVFVCWQDARNALHGQDVDLYVVEVKEGGETNLLVGDGGTSSNQREPAIGIDLYGRPYVVWADDRNTTDEIYFAASTFVEPTPLAESVVTGATGGTVGVAAPAAVDDVSVVIPADACPYDVTVRVARVRNLHPGMPADILPYEFGPSGLEFDVPVTITIPYAAAEYGSTLPQPYWYDPLTGTMTQQGVTNIEHVALSSTIHTLRFQTTHFTPYALVAAADTGEVPAAASGADGGGCSLSRHNGPSDAREFFLPFALLAAIMVGLRFRDARRHSDS